MATEINTPTTERFDRKTAQLIMWLDRTRSNIKGFKAYRHDQSIASQLTVIRHQYGLLQSLKKVITGESYLEGIDKNIFVTRNK